jgi:hypothetical protein
VLVLTPQHTAGEAAVRVERPARFDGVVRAVHRHRVASRNSLWMKSLTVTFQSTKATFESSMVKPQLLGALIALWWPRLDRLRLVQFHPDALSAFVVGTLPAAGPQRPGTVPPVNAAPARKSGLVCGRRRSGSED